MILLASTSDKVQVITGSAVTVDVHASWMDYSSGTSTPGRTNTAITTATTTDVVASPGASTQRNVKTLHIQNKHATSSVQITVQHTDGTTVVELYEATLLAGQSIRYIEDVGFDLAGASLPGQPHQGIVYSAFGYGDPNVLMREWQGGGHTNATPTDITTSIARCASFRPSFDFYPKRIRYYGVGQTSNVYRVAIYRYSDLARITSEMPIITITNTWHSVDISSSKLKLDSGCLYFFAVAVNATGATAGIACQGTTTTAAIGQVQSAPGALPGNLDLDSGFHSSFWFQFAVTTGALPATAATLAQPAVWTGGFPMFIIDGNEEK